MLTKRHDAATQTDHVGVKNLNQTAHTGGNRLAIIGQDALSNRVALRERMGVAIAA